MGELGNGAGELDAGGTRADDRKGQPRGAPLRIALALGTLEGDQDMPPQRGRVLQRLQARREFLPFVMAEIGVPRAGGEDERVIGHGVIAVEQHAAVLRVDADHSRKQRRHLGPVVHQIADRPGDLGCGQGSGRDLVEQRLKQVMVAAVDQGDLNRRALEPIGRLQPAEAGADDHHAMRI